MDAVHFLPQSRPRLFIVGALPGVLAAPGVTQAGPAAPWHTKGLVEAYGKISAKAQQSWVWWRLPVPGARRTDLEDLIEAQPKGVEWHTREQTARLLGMMSDVNRAKVAEVQASGERRVGTLYRRTRPDVGSGVKVQRAEVRFDGVAGCLRTPAGGSSRQTIIEVEGDSIRTRLLSPREAARLMGAPDSYPIPENYNEAYHLFGDGLAVPVVGWLSKHLLLRLAGNAAVTEAA
jgi:DNA (cytosine-5)-methyltransferase 1